MHTVATRIWIVAVASVVGVASTLAAFAWAQSPVEVSERFTPDRLGVSTNLSLTARFPSPPGVPPEPVRKFTVYAPAGMKIDTHGAGTCSRVALERRGPVACPTDSRAGFGGGIGVLQLPKETIREGYTLDFFFGSTKPGSLSLLVYASATLPVNVELVVLAREIRAPAPYGIGFTVEVPPVETIPGAPLASIETAYATVGADNVAYYRRVHGHRRLVHVPGLLAPRSCPPGGFPSRATIEFVDGQSTTVDPRVPCPGR